MNKNKSFFLFHLNLAFSSIEYDQHLEVINKCYLPLLETFSQQQVKFAIELSGWTLNRILEIAPELIEFLRDLIENEKVEIVGSGYSQIIGPLVPYEVNIKNHQIGLTEYKKILGITPKTVLVNEMVFSNDMAEIYQEIGYENMIMDGDNLSLSIGLKKSDFFQKKYGVGNKKEKLIKLLPTDSIIFQKFQRVAHSEITINEYMEYLSKILSNNKNIVFPLYCNDAEVFNFRPGRFDEEAQIEFDEWEIIKNILELIKNLDNHQIEFPRDICNSWKDDELELFYINSLSYPIPVKKQKKYNLARWSVTGRDDAHLNSSCYGIYNELIKTSNKNDDDWRNLLFLWSSDHRTHLTSSKWKNIKKLIQKNKSDNHIAEARVNDSDKDLSRYITNEKQYVNISTENLFIRLNKNKGMAIMDLGPIINGNNNCLVGTNEHGTFDNIELGADFFSGAMVIQNMDTSQLFSDLQKVDPTIKLIDKKIEISIKLKIKNEEVIKKIEILLDKPLINISYDLSQLAQSKETIRLSAATIKTKDLKNVDFSVGSKTGGKKIHEYNLDREFDHGSAVSHRISSTSGLPSTDGRLIFNVNNLRFSISWDPAFCYFYPLFSNNIDSNGQLIRLHLSHREQDDTLKFEGKYKKLEYSIDFS